VPAPFADASQAREYYAGSDTSGVKLEVPMRLAARLVQGYAPTPEEETDDYIEAATDAELMVGKYIFETGGYLQGATLSGTGSVTYQNDPKVLSLIASAMGDYYQSSGSSGSGANTAYTARW
jgi:hypothetical protein